MSVRHATRCAGNHLLPTGAWRRTVASNATAGEAWRRAAAPGRRCCGGQATPYTLARWPRTAGAADRCPEPRRLVAVSGARHAAARASTAGQNCCSARRTVYGVGRGLLALLHAERDGGVSGWGVQPIHPGLVVARVSVAIGLVIWSAVRYAEADVLGASAVTR